MATTAGPGRTPRFELPDGRYEGAIDALAVKYGDGASAARKALMSEGGYQRFDRVSVTFPPTLFERIGVGYTSAQRHAWSRVEIDKASGAVRILDAVTVLECGRALVPELVPDQAEGGFAMGVGYALHEYLPLYEDGPGNGTWNLDRYRVPRASDLPVWNLEIDVLPPIGPTRRTEGHRRAGHDPGGAGHSQRHRRRDRQALRSLPVTAETDQGSAADEDRSRSA